MKRCSKCKREKPFSDFSFKIQALNLLHSQCKDCTRLLIKKHYNNNKEYYLNKAKKRNTNIKLEVLSYLNKYLLKNPCVDCGESDLAVLEFDHKGKVPKFMAVSSIVRHGYPLEKIKEEVDKCEIRCANCHRRKTAKDFKWLKVNMRP